MVGEDAFTPDAIGSATAGLACVPVSGWQQCAMSGSPVFNIAPGAAEEFNVTVDVPTTVDPTGTLRNCSVIHWAAMGIPPVGPTGDDWNCADVTLLPAVVPVEAVDLEIVKGTTAESCNAGEACGFYVNVRNVGTADYTGPLFVNDLAGIMDAGPLPDGSVRSTIPGTECAVVIPGAGSTCLLSAAIDLPAGSPWHTFTFEADIPAETEPGTELRNCASINWSAMAFVGGRDFNPANDEDKCIFVPIGGAVEPGPVELAITKERIGPECEPGSTCNFAIFIRNEGTEDYEGPISFLDQARYQSSSAPGMAEIGYLSADTVAVSSPGLDCVPGDGGPVCTSTDPLRLEAGGPPVHFEATYAVPADADYTLLENCAEINWPDMAFPGGHDADTTNDAMCVDVVRTAVEEPDLALEKRTTICGYETADTYYCQFRFTIRNEGHATFSDIIRISDNVPGDADLTGSGHDGDPSWSCEQSGAPGTDVSCTSDEVVRLEPGGEKWVEIRTVMPVDSVHPGLENCADIDWGGMAFPGGHDGNAANDHSCSDLEIVERPTAVDLRLQKHGPGHCTRGGQCTYWFGFNNGGPGAYEGRLAVGDSFIEPGAGTDYPDVGLVAWADAEHRWSCENRFEGLFECVSLDDIAIGEGETIWMSVTGRVPTDYGADTLDNNATIRWDLIGIGGDAAAWNDGARDSTPISEEPPQLAIDFGVTKEAPEYCLPGGECAYRITVTNNGPEPYLGPIVLSEWLTRPTGGVDMELVDSDPSAWSCGEDGMLYRCSLDHADMVVGGPIDLNITVQVPEDMDGEELQNCAALVWDSMRVSGDSDDRNDLACESTRIGRTADLDIEGDTQCVRGESCELDIRIVNRGDQPFEGAAGLRGRLDPAVTVESVSGRMPGLICDVTGDGTYECLGSRLSIKPDEVAHIHVVIAVPADFGPDEITHIKDMVWPDAAAKDRNPVNDHDESTIDIINPAAPPAADLALSKTANQGSCTAGQQCQFSINVTNNGPRTFSGTLAIADGIDPTTTRLTGSSPNNLSCKGTRGRYNCTLAGVTLAPGASQSLSLTFTTSRSARGTLRNCAELDWSGRSRIADIQQALNDAGFNAGPADGIAGSRTRAAVSAFQKAHGLPTTGEIDAALVQALLGISAAGDPVPENDQACAEVNLNAPPAAETVTPSQPIVPPPTVQPPTVRPPQTQPPAVVEGPKCPSGWRQVGPAQAAVLVAQGRKVVPVSKAGKTILCVAPRRQVPQQQPSITPSCPKGWTQVTRTQAKALVNQGYRIQQVGSILCARKQ
jgi:peptidoglycan hydrolase-like protein with peptidoglycan-binding domain